MKLSREEVVTIIEDFINDKGGKWDWDDFISIKLKDPELERIRLICVELPDTHPPSGKGQYCNFEGIELLKKILLSLKK